MKKRKKEIISEAKIKNIILEYLAIDVKIKSEGQMIHYITWMKTFAEGLARRLYSEIEYKINKRIV